MKTSLTIAIAAILLVVTPGVAQVNIETVPVGNPGNADDTHGDGYGGVDYTYNIGKHEVTNAQYGEFLNAVDPEGANPYDLYNSSMGSSTYGGITFTAGNPDGLKYAVKPGRGDKPVNCVSFWDACRFANWLHNGQGTGNTETGAYTLTPDGIANNTVTRSADWTWAVCSEDEWYKAAYYDAGNSVYYDYPTGSNTAPKAELPAGTDLTNGSANYEYAVGNLTDVGAYDAKPSDSPYGTFDQGGNVWEWNEAIIYSDRCSRGGSFIDYYGSYDLHASHRMDIYPPSEGIDLGFRVSEVPEPATLSLLALGGLALLRPPRRPSGGKL